MDIITSRLERLELEIYEAEKEKLQREETLGDFWEHMPAIDPILIRDRMLSLQNQISSLESKKKALFKEQQHLLVQAVTLGKFSAMAFPVIVSVFLFLVKECTSRVDGGTQAGASMHKLLENSSSFTQITRCRSTSSTLSSSQKGLFRSSSRSSSKLTHFNGGLFYDNGAMGSRCHSLTLGKLYSWEKKLSEEAGEETMRIYERKHSQSRHGLKTGDKIGVEDEELRSRILVAIRNSE
ncbi:unnamed protein product [Prunus armeniaca]|uniref:DUF632 domain-containing protein n=1 Tax=Prunus armeniaca TaxID=36596 RepID=A0A6J5UXM1_PRUAR|nr:unnamed protein product [Prunus armeniaca]CAB4310790.1 unnamed protein product [Prunus armeniaca]